MKYEKPELEVIELKMLDIIKTSQITGGQGGDGDSGDDDFFG